MKRERGTSSSVRYQVWRSSTVKPTCESLIDIPHSFLANPQWRQSPEYEAAKSALSNLSAVNDSCERALALATKFNGIITKDEESFQELFLADEAHRKAFKLQKKSEFKKLF